GTALVLQEDAADWLESLPAELSFTEAGVSVLVVHGSPLGDSDYIYPSLTEDGLRRKLEPVEGPAPGVLVCGHSHVPFVRTILDTLVINCGSVGKPADGDPRGSFAVADLTSSGPPTAEIVRFEYPLEEIEAAMIEREVPGLRFRDYVEGVR